MVILLSILHKSGPALRNRTRDLMFGCQFFYDQIVIDCTDETDLDTIKGLEPFGLISIRKRQGMAEARRYVLRQGLATGADYFHYVDLDRLIFWWSNYPDELRTAIQYLQYYDLTVFERSRAAFASHPDLQRQTETRGNTLAGGVWQATDFLAATRGISRRAGQAILAGSCAEGAGVDVEWPLIVQDAGLSTGFMVCNGMGYESAELGIVKPTGEEEVLRYRNIDEIWRVVNL